MQTVRVTAVEYVDVSESVDITVEGNHNYFVTGPDCTNFVLTHNCVDAIIGKVVAKGKAVSTLPDLEMFETGIQSPRKHSTWNGIVGWLSQSEDRNKLIVRQIFKDLRSNKRACVLVPVLRVAHVHALVKMVNTQAAFNRQHRGENWPKELAVAYFGGSNTDEVINQINAGKARVTISNVRMVQRGLDVARWTHVYVGCIPTSNPMVTWQLINRVCTPYTPEMVARLGVKPQPVARLMIDSLDASVFCFVKVFKDRLYGYKAGINGTNFIDTISYKATPAALERMTTIAKFPKSYSVEDGGGKHVLGKTRKGKARTKHTWQPKKPITKF